MSNNCDTSNSSNTSNPRDFKLNESLAEHHEWDFVDSNLDEQLENELQTSKNVQAELEKQRVELLDESEDYCLRKVSNPRNAFRTRLTIGAESTKIEVLNFNGCSDSSGSLNTSTDVENSENSSEDNIAQHPNTIRRYVASMLAFFSNLRVEYVSGGQVHSRKLPVFYGNREKLLYIEEHEFQELMNGNTNYLPRASLNIDSMSYDQNRQNNKNVPVARELTMHSLTSQNAFSYVTSSPSPYNLSVRLNIITRGMNDAMMLVEQIASFFNPFYTFNLVEEGLETSVRMQLDSVTFEHPEIDQFSANEIMVEFGFTLFGNMYKPKTKEFIIDNITLNI